MRRWDNLVDQYMKEYSSRGCAQGTVEGIRRELDKWGIWMKRRRPKPRLEEIDSELLIRYIGDRSVFHSKATISSVVSKMRCMGEFLVREGYWAKNPFRWIRGPKLDHRRCLPRRLSKQAMRQLWEAVAKNRQGYGRSLWLAVLSILYGAGVRRGELIRLDVEHWIPGDATLRVDGRKTGYERQMVLPEISRRCLEAYLIERHNYLEKVGRLEEKALFVNRNGVRMKGPQITRGINRIARRAGLEGVTVHQFRHTCASDLLEAGLHVSKVKAILGHQSIATTVRYLDVSDPERAAAVGRHPINDILKAREDNNEA